MEDDGFKTCPFCKEKIRVTAIKCRFCGEWLEQAPTPIPSQSVAQRQAKIPTQDAKDIHTISTTAAKPAPVKSKQMAASESQKQSFESPLDSWAKGINNIPSPKNSKTAYSLIFNGLIVLFIAMGVFISLGLVAEKTNRYSGPISLAAWEQR